MSNIRVFVNGEEVAHKVLMHFVRKHRHTPYFLRHIKWFREKLFREEPTNVVQINSGYSTGTVSILYETEN